jgi:hypothetical protein
MKCASHTPIHYVHGQLPPLHDAFRLVSFTFFSLLRQAVFIFHRLRRDSNPGLVELVVKTLRDDSLRAMGALLMRANLNWASVESNAQG